MFKATRLIWKKKTISLPHRSFYLCSLVIDAVLIVDVQQFVLDPGDLLGRLLPGLMVQAVFFIKLSQAHHGLLTHTPLPEEEKQTREDRFKWGCCEDEEYSQVIVMLHIWECTGLTLLSKVLSRTKPKSWSLTKLRSFFPALMMVTMTSWRMASSGSWERTLRYSEWIMSRKKTFNPHLC